MRGALRALGLASGERGGRLINPEYQDKAPFPEVVVKLGDRVKVSGGQDFYIAVSMTRRWCALVRERLWQDYLNDNYYPVLVRWDQIRTAEAKPGSTYGEGLEERTELIGRVRELEDRLAIETRKRREAERSRP